MGRFAKEDQVRRDYRMDGLTFRRLRELMRVNGIENETAFIEALITDAWYEAAGEGASATEWELSE